MLPDEEISFTRVLDASFLNTPEQLIGITIFGIVSLLVEVPWIWISRGEKAEKIKSRIGLWVVYCLVLTIVEIGLLFALLGSPGPQSAGVFAELIISHQVMGAIMLGVCLAVRGLGYRLERSLSKQTDPEAANESDATPLVPDPESI